MSREYGHLFNVKTGTNEWGIKISLKGYVPSAGGSGHVPAGRYKMKIKTAQLVAHKTDPGKRNVLLACEVFEPEEFRAVPINKYIPAPKSDSAEDSGYRTFQNLAWSRLTAEPQLLEKATQAEELSIGGQALEGKFFFASLRDGEGEYSNRSEIAYFISVDEFAARPGPDKFAMSSASSPQTGRPDVFAGHAPANGSGASVQQDAAQALFGI